MQTCVVEGMLLKLPNLMHTNDGVSILHPDAVHQQHGWCRKVSRLLRQKSVHEMDRQATLNAAFFLLELS